MLDYRPYLYLLKYDGVDRAYGFGFDMNTPQTIGSFFIYTGDRFRYANFFNYVVIDGIVRVGDSTNYEENPVCATVWDQGFYTCD